MGRLRWIAVFALLASGASCSDGAPAALVERAPLPEPVATTSTVPAPEAPAAAVVPASSASAVADPSDPIPGGVPASGRTRRHTSSRGPQPTGHIEIPAIGLSHATYEGIDLPTINHGPSHWPGTAAPGRPGNTVFAGHRTTYSRPFWAINELAAGDEVVFTTPAGRFTYRVTRTFVVSWRDTSIVDQTKDATFTIFACHPRGSARQRYVAKGTLVSSVPTTPPTTRSPTTTSTTTTTTSPPRRPVVDLLPG